MNRDQLLLDLGTAIGLILRYTSQEIERAAAAPDLKPEHAENLRLLAFVRRQFLPEGEPDEAYA